MAQRPPDSTLSLLLALPLALWRHPGGKSLFTVAAALAALWSGWLFVFQVLLLVSLWLFIIFDN